MTGAFQILRWTLQAQLVAILYDLTPKSRFLFMEKQHLISGKLQVTEIKKLPDFKCKISWTMKRNDLFLARLSYEGLLFCGRPDFLVVWRNWWARWIFQKHVDGAMHVAAFDERTGHPTGWPFQEGKKNPSLSNALTTIQTRWCSSILLLPWRNCKHFEDIFAKDRSWSIEAASACRDAV